MTGGTGRSIAKIVADDLCVGCGLCEALTGGRVKMVMTPAGSLRPSTVDGFTRREEAQLVAACPGAVNALGCYLRSAVGIDSTRVVPECAVAWRLAVWCVPVTIQGANWVTGTTETPSGRS